METNWVPDPWVSYGDQVARLADPPTVIPDLLRYEHELSMPASTYYDWFLTEVTR